MNPDPSDALTPEERVVLADLAAEVAEIAARYRIRDYEREIAAAEERASARMRALDADQPVA